MSENFPTKRYYPGKLSAFAQKPGRDSAFCTIERIMSENCPLLAQDVGKFSAYITVLRGKMNPYESPQQGSISERVPAVKTAATSRRFRWGTVPAALSWCFGGVSLIAIPFVTYHTLKMLPPSADAEWAERMMVYGSRAMIPCPLVSGCLNCFAGMRWLQGRWIQALLLNAGAYGVIAIPQLMQDAAVSASRNI
jgi:hypothetical protein